MRVVVRDQFLDLHAPRSSNMPKAKVDPNMVAQTVFDSLVFNLGVVGRDVEEADTGVRLESDQPCLQGLCGLILGQKKGYWDSTQRLRVLDNDSVKLGVALAGIVCRIKSDRSSRSSELVQLPRGREFMTKFGRRSIRRPSEDEVSFSLLSFRPNGQ